MGLPNVPVPAMLTDKFCGCLELTMALRIISLVYVAFWVVFAVLEIVLGITYVGMLHFVLPESISGYVAGSWCILTAVSYLLVVVGIQISNRAMLLPAMAMSLGNIVILLLQAAINAITIILIFHAIVGLIFVAFLAYYTVCLKALYDKMGQEAPPPAGMEGEQQYFDQV